MENKPIKEEEPNQYKLLDLIPRERKWALKSEDEGTSGGGGARNHHFCANEKKLELRLGLPGEDEEEESKPKKREGYNGNYRHKFPSSCTNAVVPKSSHKRTAPGAAVGWPPVRSFRKNLGSTSSAKPLPNPPPRPPPPPPPPIEANKNPTENLTKGLFVKINMEGVPIGRKVDLKAHDNYDKLCSAVDTLFRGLLAAQMESSSCGVLSKQEREKPITCLLDGCGEYTLVYEDNEGDRMLVGDVPWHMFVSTVKRLRVLKSSELPSLSKFGGKQGKRL